MLPHRRHDFIVQVFDEVVRFLFDSFSSFAHCFTYTASCLFYFAIEIAHNF